MDNSYLTVQNPYCGVDTVFKTELLDLPEHVLVHVLCFVGDACSICSCSRACKQLNVVAASPLVWPNAKQGMPLCPGLACWELAGLQPTPLCHTHEECSRMALDCTYNIAGGVLERGLRRCLSRSLRLPPQVLTVQVEPGRSRRWPITVPLYNLRSLMGVGDVEELGETLSGDVQARLGRLPPHHTHIQLPSLQPPKTTYSRGAFTTTTSTTTQKQGQTGSQVAACYEDPGRPSSQPAPPPPAVSPASLTPLAWQLHDLALVCVCRADRGTVRLQLRPSAAVPTVCAAIATLPWPTELHEGPAGGGHQIGQSSGSQGCSSSGRGWLPGSVHVVSVGCVALPQAPDASITLNNNVPRTTVVTTTSSASPQQCHAHTEATQQSSSSQHITSTTVSSVSPCTEGGAASRGGGQQGDATHIPTSYTAASQGLPAGSTCPQSANVGTIRDVPGAGVRLGAELAGCSVGDGNRGPVEVAEEKAGLRSREDGGIATASAPADATVSTDTCGLIRQPQMPARSLWCTAQATAFQVCVGRLSLCSPLLRPPDAHRACVAAATAAAGRAEGGGASRLQGCASRLPVDGRPAPAVEVVRCEVAGLLHSVGVSERDTAALVPAVVRLVAMCAPASPFADAKAWSKVIADSTRAVWATWVLHTFCEAIQEALPGSPALGASSELPYCADHGPPEKHQLPHCWWQWPVQQSVLATLSLGAGEDDVVACCSALEAFPHTLLSSAPPEVQLPASSTPPVSLLVSLLTKATDAARAYMHSPVAQEQQSPLASLSGTTAVYRAGSSGSNNSSLRGLIASGDKVQGAAQLASGLWSSLHASSAVMLRGDAAVAWPQSRPPLTCAHGGDAYKAPPNTAAAFSAAIEAKVDCVEVDVARTKDNMLVVLHVRELQQLAHDHMRRSHSSTRGNGRDRMHPGSGGSSGGGVNNKKGQHQWFHEVDLKQVTPWGSMKLGELQVGDLTWSQLSQLAWPGGHTVMKVADAISLTSPFVDCVTLDIKTYVDRSTGQDLDTQPLVEGVVRVVHDTGCSNCLVWAKSDEVVMGVKRESPGQRAGVIAMDHTPDARAANMHLPLRLPGPEVVGAHWSMVNASLTHTLAGHGMQLFTWTVNQPAELQRVLDAGVDAIVTNEIAATQEAISWRLARCGGVQASAHQPPPAWVRVRGNDGQL